MINSRQKGARGERAFAALLRENGFDARRGQQFSGSPDSPDVVCEALSWAHFEVKVVERLDIYGAMEQARRDSGGRAAFVAHRRNFWPWLVSMDAERFYRLLSADLTGDWAERMGSESPAAVFAGLPWAFCEVRETARLNVHEAMAQAKRSAGGRVVLFAHRRVAGASANGGGWLVTMTAETFFEFLRGTLPPESTGAERQESNETTTQQ